MKRAHSELVNSMTGSYELPLAYVGFDDSLLFVFKVQEVLAFFEAVGKRHLPFAEDVITFFLFAE